MPHAPARPAVSVDSAVARLARRLGPQHESPGWSPPAPALLIDRIEAALAERRQQAGQEGPRRAG